MARTSEAQITYTPRPDTTAEAEVDALAAVYCFILDCKAKKEGGPDTAPDEGERSSDEFASTKKHTR
jgi:hypothetical protein